MMIKDHASNSGFRYILDKAEEKLDHPIALLNRNNRIYIYSKQTKFNLHFDTDDHIDEDTGDEYSVISIDTIDNYALNLQSNVIAFGSMTDVKVDGTDLMNFLRKGSEQRNGINDLIDNIIEYIGRLDVNTYESFNELYVDEPPKITAYEAAVQDMNLRLAFSHAFDMSFADGELYIPETLFVDDDGEQLDVAITIENDTLLVKHSNHFVVYSHKFTQGELNLLRDNNHHDEVDVMLDTRIAEIMNSL